MLTDSQYDEISITQCPNLVDSCVFRHSFHPFTRSSFRTADETTPLAAGAGVAPNREWPAPQKKITVPCSWPNRGEPWRESNGRMITLTGCSTKVRLLSSAQRGVRACAPLKPRTDTVLSQVADSVITVLATFSMHHRFLTVQAVGQLSRVCLFDGCDRYGVDYALVVSSDVPLHAGIPLGSSFLAMKPE